jgi:lipoate---protein ligase
MASGGWAVERWRGHPRAFHGRPLPEPVARQVWICEPTAAAVVLGSAQPAHVVDAPACDAAGVAVVRRRSGGGAVLVAPGRQLWIDVLLPAGDPLWSADVARAFLWLGEVWAAALADVGIAGSVHRGPLRATEWSPLVCFAGVGAGEVLDDVGAKVVGLSQRRTRSGARFQCAVPVEWEVAGLLGLLALDDPRRAAGREALAGAGRGVGAAAGALERAFLRRLP